MNVNKKINYKAGLTCSLPFLLSVYKSKLVKCREEDYDNLPMPFDGMEGNELSDILENPNFQGDTEHLMEERMYNSIHPPQFAYLHSQFKTSLDHESWKGLKLGFSWHPTMTLNSEFQLTVDKMSTRSLNNYVFSITTVLPNEKNPNKGTVLLGRSEGGQKLMFQTHGDISNSDKIIVAGHYMSPDPNQGAYEIEYNKKLDRLQFDFKFSPMGLSLSAVTALTKGTFIGFEGTYSPQHGTVMYSYGAKSKLPIQNLSCAFTYIGYMPYLMFDLMYKYNNNLSFYGSYSKNDMMGKTDLKLVNILFIQNCKYKWRDYDIMGGLSNFTNLHGYLNYKVTKHVSVQGNLEFAPLSLINKRGRGPSGKIGFGLHFSGYSQDELILQNEKEDFSNFNYDNYLNA